MRVQAAVARVYGAPLQIETLELADPASDEILVRLVASGVGRVDGEAVAGVIPMPLPFVPGSEGAGIVERVGDLVRDLHPGDAVIIDYAACQTCQNCVAGHPRICVDFAARNLSGRRLGCPPPFREGTNPINGYFFGQSSFATHVVCRATDVIKLPSDSPLEIVAAFGGEILAGVAAITDAFRLRPGETLAITGAGIVGIVACMIAKDRGTASIVIADPDAQRRALAAEYGATVAVHADHDLGTAVRSLNAKGADFALETTGRATARHACLASLRSGGTMSLTQSTDDDQEHTHGKIVIPIDRCLSPRTLVPELVALYANGRFPIDRLVTFYPLAQVNEAITAMEGGQALKPVIRFSLGAFDDLDRAKSRSMGSAASDDVPATPSDERIPAVPVRS